MALEKNSKALAGGCQFRMCSAIAAHFAASSMVIDWDKAVSFASKEKSSAIGANQAVAGVPATVNSVITKSARSLDSEQDMEGSSSNDWV